MAIIDRKSQSSMPTALVPKLRTGCQKKLSIWQGVFSKIWRPLRNWWSQNEESKQHIESAGGRGALVPRVVGGVSFEFVGTSCPPDSHSVGGSLCHQQCDRPGFLC